MAASQYQNPSLVANPLGTTSPSSGGNVDFSALAGSLGITPPPSTKTSLDNPIGNTTKSSNPLSLTAPIPGAAPATYPSGITNSPNTTPPKPVSVVSSSGAIDQANQAKNDADTYTSNQSNLAQTKQQSDAADANTPNNSPTLSGSGLPNPNYIAPTQDTTGTNQSTSNTLPEGQTSYYNLNNGLQENLPTPPDGSVPKGYSTTDPQKVAVTSSVQDNSNNTLNQYANGTYGLVDGSGNFQSITAQTFQNVQQAQQASTALRNLQNGVLSPSQQTQLNNLISMQQSVMSKLITDSNMKTGGMAEFQSQYGQGVASGPGAITQVINNGATAIAQLQVSQAAAVDAMNKGFINDDTDAVASAWGQYKDADNAITNAIKNTTDEIQKQSDKQDAALLAAGNKADFAHPDAGINPGVDSYATIQDKILKSQSYQLKQSALGGDLSDTEANFYAEAGATGTSGLSKLASEFTGFGNTATKNQVLKRIADNANAVGLSGGDFAAALDNAHAKQLALNYIDKQGSQTEVNEQSASDYFDTLNQLATTVDKSTFESGIPLIDNYIKTGETNFTGNPATVNFANQLVESMTEYAKVMTGQTSGSAVSDTAQATAQQLLNQGFNANTIKSFTTLAKNNMANRLDSFNKSSDDIKNILKTTNKSVTDIMGNQSSPNSSTTGFAGGGAF